MSQNDKPRRVLRKDRLKPRNNDVGYGRPPKAHRFKPGRSGNPKGRPKGAKSERTILLQLLHQTIEMRQGGKIRRITVLEGILRRIVEDSLKGNLKSAAFSLQRLAAILSLPGDEPEMSRDDKAVLDAYLESFLHQDANRKGPA
jgi:hypothetical protein